MLIIFVDAMNGLKSIRSISCVLLSRLFENVIEPLCYGINLVGEANLKHVKNLAISYWFSLSYLP